MVVTPLNRRLRLRVENEPQATIITFYALCVSGKGRHNT